MERSRLVQRLNPPYTKGSLADLKGNPFAFGGGLKNGGLSQVAMELLGGIFSFDYMGAAQFEWGAVPESLSKIAENCQDYVAFTIIDNDNRIHVICRRADAVEVHQRIMGWASQKYNHDLLETIHLWFVLNPSEIEGDWVPKTCGWLELNNNFFFFTDEEMFEATCNLFQIER